MKMSFLAGLRVHVPEERAEIGEFLPIVARHLPQERAFAMDDFVMREREQKIFLEGIKHAEGEVAVVMFAIHRIKCHVFQRVMHPAHIPFHAEAQAARIGGARDGWP